MKSLQFITHYTERYSYLDSARMALEGGCRWIQLRMKDAGKEEILPIATEIRKLCNDCGAIFIIDDHVELVREIRADGVHLGKNDMPVAEARRILGDEYIIGGTANTYEDVKKHWLDGVNYIGCGPFRYTTTKQKLSPILGLEGYKEIIRQMRAENINLPIVAIGGITSQIFRLSCRQELRALPFRVPCCGRIIRWKKCGEYLRQSIKQTITELTNK